MANVFKTEECWQEYRSSLSSNSRDNISEPLLLIQVTQWFIISQLDPSY